MKLAIFGNTRSGTTMLRNTLWQHLLASGENESWSQLSEMLRPRFGNLVGKARLVRGGNIVIEIDGHLQMQPLSDLSSISNFKVLPDAPIERFNKLVEYSHQDYFIKLMPSDLREMPEIIPWMRDNYNIIAIERRNPLAAFISNLIAHRHSRWHVTTEDDHITYIPFAADMDDVEHFGRTYSHYYQYRDALKPTRILYYEDLVNISQESIIRMAGMEPLPIKYEAHATVKVHSFQEKQELILNYDEVEHHFETVMKLYGVKSEHNNL